MSKPRALAEHPNTRGTAAVADVTTSPTDTTADRLLKVGDFGWGGTALEQNGPTFTTYVGGLDDVRHNGLYGVDIAPAGGNDPLSGVVLHTDRYDDGLGVVRAQQMYFGGGSTPLHQQVRVRNLVNTTWGLWRKVYEQNSIVGTVSQDAGVPTGAIIERDISNNGEYVKFADGTMICFGRGAVGSPNLIFTVTEANTREQFSWSFPAEFAQAPAVQYQIGQVSSTLGYTLGVLACNTVNTSTADLHINVSAAQEYRIDALAIGRWF